MDTTRLNTNTADQSVMATDINTVYYFLRNKRPLSAISHLLVGKASLI